jgi:hypothetical protein
MGGKVKGGDSLGSSGHGLGQLRPFTQFNACLISAGSM